MQTIKSKFQYLKKKKYHIFIDNSTYASDTHTKNIYNLKWNHLHVEWWSFLIHYSSCIFLAGAWVWGWNLSYIHTSHCGGFYIQTFHSQIVHTPSTEGKNTIVCYFL